MMSFGLQKVILCCAIACFSGCNLVSEITIKSRELKVFASSSKITIANNLQLTASGGLAPYKFEIVSGSGQINATTGEFSPQTKGLVQLKVSDTKGIEKIIEIEVKENLQFVSNTVDWAQGVGIQFDLSNLINGGVPPFIYTKFSDGLETNLSSGTFTQDYGWGDTQIRSLDSLGNSSQITLKRRPTLFNGQVNVIKENAGNLYIGGSFTAINSYSITQFAELNSISGDLTPSTCNWQKKITGGVSSILVENDFMYIGGSINKFNGTTVAGLIKINRYTCELDTVFSQPTGFGSSVKAIFLSGDNLFVGGSFNNYRGVSIRSIAKIDKITGNLDTQFFNGTTVGGGSQDVTGLAVTADSVYIAGWFSTYRGLPAQNLAKFDSTTGVLDQTFTTATGLNSSANDLLIKNGSLYVSGQFWGYRGQTALNIAKIDLISGNLDTTFNQATGFDSTVFNIEASEDSIYALGQFTSYRGPTAQKLAKIDLNSGVLDLTFTQPTGMTTLSHALKILGNSLYIGGSPTIYRGNIVEGLIKIDKLTGALDTNFSRQTGFGYVIQVLEGIESENKLYVGGTFTTYRGNRSLGLVKMNKTTGQIDENFINNAALGIVSDVAYHNGSLYVAGGPGGITKLDATTGVIDLSFTQSPGFTFSTRSIVITNNALYVGGSMTTFNGVAVNRLAKIDLITGALDTTFTLATGLNNWVNQLATDGVSLYVAGGFSQYRGVAAQRIAKLNLNSGALDTTFTQATGLDSEAKTLLLSGGDIYVGGGFSTYRGTSVAGLVKLNKLNGALDTTFSQATGFSAGFPVRTMIEHAGSLYVGGEFFNYRGTSRPYIAKLETTNGNLDLNFSDSIGYDDHVLAIYSDGNHLYTGGPFKNFSGVSTNYFLRSSLTSAQPE